MDNGTDEKKRQSIAFINRRRRRSNKTGANSGEVVKNWSDYGKVSFTPSGGALSGWKRFFAAIGVFFLMLVPFLLVYIDTIVLDQLGPGVMLYSLVFFILGVLALGALVIAAYFVRILWHSIIQSIGYKKE